MRSSTEHMEQIKKLGIDPIDMVVVNLYPFKRTIEKPGTSFEEAIENIDIGGPTMLRSAAKNHTDVTVVTDPADYPDIIAEIREEGTVTPGTRLRLAYKVFAHTAAYDALIADYLRRETGIDVFSTTVTLTYEKVQELRYGENPFQNAAFYREISAAPAASGLTGAKQLHGKELSYNNINDANGAIELVKEFDRPSVIAVKHANPCGAGSAGDIYTAYMKAYKADPVSIFGGIIAANKEIDEKTAEEIGKIFVEIVIAPSYSTKALEILKKKKNIRILELSCIADKIPYGSTDMKKVLGGMLYQTYDNELYDEAELKCVTKASPSKEELDSMKFAMKIVKHVKSNAIVIAKDNQTQGVGPGQVNRISAVELAIKFAAENGLDTTGAVMASDAFFPFRDCVDAAAKAGIKAVIQPGGSLKDQESIDACDEHGIAMIFTGKRHFKH